MNSIRGSSLLEVLIAAVVLGIGLLGISALQITSLRGSESAEYRSRAALFAFEISERMWANKMGVSSYVTSEITESEKAYCSSLPEDICSMANPDYDIDDISICSPSQLAAHDLWELRCRSGVKGTLPGGRMRISLVGPETYQVNISWLRRDVSFIRGNSRAGLSMRIMPGIVR